jgi:peptidoglycan/xylan/chitin deacetylase (PgdA/CDA1 family)
MPLDVVHGRRQALGDTLYVAGVLVGAAQWIATAEPHRGARVLVRDLGRALLAWALAARWRASSRRVGLALVYHGLADRAGDPDHELVPAISAATFRRQLRHLRRHYSVIRAADLPAAAQGRRRWSRIPVAVTFDDDLLSHRTHAAPALRDAGLTATFFLGSCTSPPSERYWWELLEAARDDEALTPDRVPELDPNVVAQAASRVPRSLRLLGREIEELPTENRDTVTKQLRSISRSRNPGLSCDDVAYLAREGFEIGFHTVAHHLMASLDDERLREALTQGRSELERFANTRIQVLAYPHGKADGRVAAAAAAAHYSLAYVGIPHPVTPDSNPHLLGRLEAPRVAGPSFALRLIGVVGGRAA